MGAREREREGSVKCQKHSLQFKAAVFQGGPKVKSPYWSQFEACYSSLSIL